MIEDYPLTDFATDAQFKIELINDRLAGKEMYIEGTILKIRNGYQQLKDLKIF